MNRRTKFKRRLWIIIIAVFVSLGLCVGGLVLPGKELPEISLAAEPLPVYPPLPGFGQGIPNTLPTALAVTLVLVTVGFLYHRDQRRAARGGQESRLLIAVDAIFEGAYSFVEGIAGEEFAPAFFPLVGSFFIFILTANWMGLLPGVGSLGVWEEHHGRVVLVPFFRSPSSDLSTTLGLAVVSLVATQYFGFKFQGLSYLRRFFNFSASSERDASTAAGGFVGVIQRLSYYIEMGANGLVGLLELASELIKILSFAFRLFGNIFAGEVLLVVVSSLAAFVVAVPFIGLELFVGLIQALIFAMLSLVFFKMATHHH